MRILSVSHVSVQHYIDIDLVILFAKVILILISARLLKIKMRIDSACSQSFLLAERLFLNAIQGLLSETSVLRFVFRSHD